MKEETKRFYEFTFEQLKEKLNLEGEFEAYSNKDDRGHETSTLKIITKETKQKSE